MSVDQFEMIMADYLFDFALPPENALRWKKEFRRISYSQWAVNELRRFIFERLYPAKEASIQELINMIEEFMLKCRVYYEKKRESGVRFSIALSVANDLRDILMAMK